MQSLLPAAIPVFPIAYLLSLPALSFQAVDPEIPTTTDDHNIPLTYEKWQEWFKAVNKTRKLAKGDNCTMHRNANIDLYIDVVHPYKSTEKENFMKHLNLNTKKIAPKEQLKVYWNQRNSRRRKKISEFHVVRVR
jgi:hypothetical protein